MNDAELRVELERLHTASFGWALACCRRDVGLAECALQSSYVKILDGRAKFLGRSTFRTWLFGVIRRTAMEENRKAFVRRLLAPWHSPPETPEQDASREETHRRLTAALRSLPARQQEVLELVFYHDMTLDEAAVVIGVSPGTARVHYSRGKARLREFLSDSRSEDERRIRTANLV